jgi:hypothetical protein
MPHDELQAVVSLQVFGLLVEIIVLPGGIEVVERDDNARNDDDDSSGVFFHYEASEVDRTGN